MRADRSPTRQLLVVTVYNPGVASVRLRVAELNSELGSFVPVPETFSLEPGESQTLEAMRGNRTYNFEKLDVSVRIRTVDTNDTKVIPLVRAEPPTS